MALTKKELIKATKILSIIILIAVSLYFYFGTIALSKTELEPFGESSKYMAEQLTICGALPMATVLMGLTPVALKRIFGIEQNTLFKSIIFAGYTLSIGWYLVIIFYILSNPETMADQIREYGITKNAITQIVLGIAPLSTINLMILTKLYANKNNQKNEE